MRAIQFKPDIFSCRLCGATIGQKEVFPERYLNAGQTIRRCGYCSCVYLAPDFTDQTLDLFYKKTYKELFPAEYIGEKIENFFKYRKDDFYAEKRFQLIEGYVPHYGRLLEVGSGFGNFINQVGIHRSDIIKFALEPDEMNRSKSIHDTSIKFINGTDFKSLIDTFDLVAAFHVLEHITNPHDFLKGLIDMIKEGGYLVIEVPNLKKGAGSQKYFHAAHLSYFTENTLESLLKSVGLSINYCGPSEPDSGASDALWAIAQKKYCGSNQQEIRAASEKEIMAIDGFLTTFSWTYVDRLRDAAKRLVIRLLGVALYGAFLRRIRSWLGE